MDVKEAQQKSQEYQEWAGTDPFTVIAAATEVTHDLSPSERQKFAPLIESVRRLEAQSRVLLGAGFAGSTIPSQK
jgi:hypothetical protein